MFFSLRTYRVSESCLDTETTIDEKAVKASSLAFREVIFLQLARASASSSVTPKSNQKSCFGESGLQPFERKPPNLLAALFPAIESLKALHLATNSRSSILSSALIAVVLLRAIKHAKGFASTPTAFLFKVSASTR